MTYQTLLSFSLLLALGGSTTMAQTEDKKVMNDSNTPLHLLKPDYTMPYGALTVSQVKADMDRVFNYIDKETPAVVEDKTTGKEITNYKKINTNSQLRRGAFRLTSYEWGVTYSALLDAAEATGDTRYYDYVKSRLTFLSQVAPYFKKAGDRKDIDSQMRKAVYPQALDDCGAICAAMMKASQKDKQLPVADMIRNYFDFIWNKEYRLSDGTFARIRPQYNTLWLDDMFMGIPAVAQMGRYSQEADKEKYFTAAANQFLGFAKRMFIPEKGLYRHGWVESSTDHPAFCWGRANGWAMLTACEVLDVLPENHPQRAAIMDLFRQHVRGIAALQSGTGRWHQLLDRNDSYLETSASAIYVYCLAHAICKGWIDPIAYGPVAQLGWNAVSAKINPQGQVEGVCVGTGMGFDPAFYYFRPVNIYAAHGYGPVLWAGAEMIKLLKTLHPKMNDSAVQYYTEEQDTNEPIFSVKVKK